MSLLTNRISLSDSPHRRGFFIALFILHTLISLGFATESAPASFAIVSTRDQLGQPVPYVSLILQPENIWLMSDEQGRFILDRALFSNDSLQIMRIGFVNEHLALSDVLSSGIIQLTPGLIQGQAVLVTTFLSPEHHVSPLIQFAKSEAQGLMDHAQIIHRIPGVSIRSYGGPAGISTMSMDGGPSSHTKVLVDEIDITSSQNGEADLSQIPLPFIESMSYTPYDITSNFHGNIDGEIKLASGNQQSHMAFSTGSFGHRAYDLTLALPIRGFHSSIQLGQRHETADYQYDLYNRQGYRDNNQMDQQFVAIRSSKMLGANTFLKFTGLESHQSRGAAGLIWSPDTLSHRNDMLRIMGSTLGRIRPTGKTVVQVATRQSREHYQNPSILLDSRHELQSLVMGIKDERRIHPSLQLFSNFKWSRDMIRSSDASQHVRESWDASFTVDLELVKSLALIPSFKSQHSNDLYHESFSDLQIILRLPRSIVKNISASQGHVFNYPSFNDLFWEPGGNPDLEPERTLVQTIQSKVDLSRLGQIMLQWQKKDSDNLIQWMPVHSYWQPNNVLSATRESQKMAWHLPIPQIDMVLDAHISRISTLDHQLQKPLRYAPTRISASTLSWTPGSAEFHVNYHFVSERISMYSWPEDVLVKSNEIWSASAGYTWTQNHSTYTLVLSGDNLLNTNYESIRGYPEPGRSYRISANYAF